MQRMGLYYPYIHFRDERWLKLAALYWPRIARVVPHGYGVRDSRTAKVLADELDFIVNVPPDRSAAAVAEIFAKAIEQEACQLAQEFGVFTADLAISPDNWHVDDGAANSWILEQNRRPYRPSARRPGKRLAGVYRGEVAPELREMLTGAGLALETSRDIQVGTAAREVGDWLAMDPRLAWLYKCVLTEHLARDNGLEPLTDGIASHALTQPWTTDLILDTLHEPADAPDGPQGTGPAHEPAAAQEHAAQIAMLALQLVVPLDLKAVPAERIVAVRKGCGAEFDAFRDAVTAAAGELTELPLESAESHITAAYLDQVVARRFTQPLADLRSAMHGLGVETALGAIGMKFEIPATIAVLSATLMAGQPVVATAGGLAFALAGLGRSWKQGQQARLKASPESYLLRIDKSLKPRSLLARVADPRRHNDRTT